MGKGEGHRAVANQQGVQFIPCLQCCGRGRGRTTGFGRVLDSPEGEASAVDCSQMTAARACRLGMLDRVEIVLSVVASPRIGVADAPQLGEGIPR